MTGETAGGGVGEPWAGMAMGQGPSCGQGTPRAGTEHIVVPPGPQGHPAHPQLADTRDTTHPGQPLLLCHPSAGSLHPVLGWFGG